MAEIEKDTIKTKENEKFAQNLGIQKILAYKRQGISDTEISKMSDIPYAQTTVSKYVRKSIELGLITEKEIEEAKDKKQEKERYSNEYKKLKENPTVQKILNYKMQGMADNEIFKMPNIPYSRTTVTKYVKRSIKIGLITEKEIEEAKNKRKKIEKQNNPDRKRVLKGLRLGELDNVIAQDTTVGYSQVGNIRKSLIKEGIITQEEIGRAREEAKQNNKGNELDAEPIDEEKLLSYLILGYDSYRIKEKIGFLDTDSYKEAVNKLIKEGRIAEEEISEYRKRKEEEDKAIILEKLKKGMSQRKIAKDINLYQKKVRIYIEELKQEYNISNEDILRWKNEKENSIEKRKNAVLEGLKQGLTKGEIVKKYPKQELKITDIGNYRNILIRDGAITEEEIIQHRQSRKEKTKQARYLRKIKEEEKEKKRKEDGEKKKQTHKFNQLKREINTEVKFEKNPSTEKKEKIREYINLCYKIYQEEKISLLELLFLRKAIQKVPIDDIDIIQFAKLCISIGEYKEGLDVVRSRYKIKETTMSKEKEDTLKKLECSLEKACKVQQAIQIIKKGTTNTEVVSSVTGLSRDEVNILKIKLSRKPLKLMNVSQREKIVKLLLKGKDSKIIQKKLDISDFEMQDIEQQARYRKIDPDKRDLKAQISQDSNIRIEVLFTKLGKNPDWIAKGLGLEIKEVEEDIKSALEFNLIKLNELQGINLLEYQFPKFKQMEL